MSYQVVELVLDNGPADATETLVMVAIAENASDAGYAYPGIARIAHRSRCCERHAIRIIKKLASDGWLDILPKAEGPGKKQTAYQLDLHRLGSSESHALQIALEKSRRIENKRVRLSGALQVSPDKSHDMLSNSQVTFDPLSHDISPLPILKNHEPSIEPSEVLTLTFPQSAPSPATEQPAHANKTDWQPPPWLDLEAWHAYDAMRKKIRKPMTEYARELVIKKLQRFEAQGFSSTQSLENSIRNSWIAVYEPKPEGRGAHNGKPTGSEQIFESSRAAANILAAAPFGARLAGGDGEARKNPGRPVESPTRLALVANV